MPRHLRPQTRYRCNEGPDDPVLSGPSLFVIDVSQVLSVFKGVTTPTSELYRQIEQHGWTVTKVAWDPKRNAFTATARDPYGVEREKWGPNDKTALANLLITIARNTHMRTAAQYKLGMWKTNWTDQLKEIAEAYAQAPVYDPKAAVYFKELADDSTRRAHVLGQHLHIEVTPNPEPYANAQEMADDIHKNKHFLVSNANCDHPLWSVEQNVAFRVVHDVLGHAVSGGDFGWQGENLACAAHFPLLSPTAQIALFTECIAQTGYAAYYRSFGPQKIAAFPQFLEDAQKAENPMAHRGIHPSQSVPPTSMPNVGESPPAPTPYEPGHEAPHMQYDTGLEYNLPQPKGLTPTLPPTFSSKRASAVLSDPNQGWESNIPPLDPAVNIHPKTGQPIGNAYMHHGDPLEADKVHDTAMKIDTQWWTKPYPMQKLAIVNAFRVVLLSPRKDLRWNAVHYQHIAHIPGDVDDPKVYWDALEKQRQEWNVQQVRNHLQPDVDRGLMTKEQQETAAEKIRFAHQAWRKQWPRFFAVFASKHYTMNSAEAQEAAERLIMNWETEEQQKLAAEDAKKPPEKQASQDAIERKAQANMVKRMKVYTDESTEKMDVLAAAPEQMGMFEAEPEFERPPIDKYGAWMGTHLKAIAQISAHADEILEAALEDLKNHDGTGHHFRATVLQLNVSGVGPKVCSFAWLLLCPGTSQLATMDTHMSDVLGHNFEKDLNNRDYFRFERELQAGRDAAGYSHVPLGQFQWGMWDHKRTGPGTHQDHSAMAVLDPKPHESIDWAKKALNLKADDWLKQAPDWWQNTQAAREAVRKQWDESIAKTTGPGNIPYQITEDDMARAASLRFVEAGESTKEFHVAIKIPDDKLVELAAIAEDLPMRKEKPENYHITAFWSTEGYDRQELHEWIRKADQRGFHFTNARLDCFPSNATDDEWAIVLKLDAPEAKELVTQLMDEAEDHGLEIRRFPGGWKPHITLGWSDEKIEAEKYPEIEFRSGPLYVSIPRPLRRVGAEPQPLRPLGMATKMQKYRATHPGLSTAEIWRLHGDNEHEQDFEWEIAPAAVAN